MTKPKKSAAGPYGGVSPDLGDPETYGVARRLFFSRFSRRLVAAGLDEDDAFQEILVCLVTRACSASRWNPERGALATWLYWAMSGAVINTADKAMRAARRNGTVGIREDIASERGAGGSVPGAMDVRDLARELDVPIEVVGALIDGLDVYEGAIEGGCDMTEAASIAWALG